MARLVRTPELLGAYTSGFGKDAIKDFVANPEQFAEAAGIRENVKVKTVENSNDTINVVLPFYSKAEKRAGIELSDEDLHAASGGLGNAQAPEDFLTKEELIIYNMAKEACAPGYRLDNREAYDVGQAAFQLLHNKYPEEFDIGK